MITLYPHQSRAAAEVEERLHSRRLCYLTGEVRTGKTITALEVVRSMGFDTVLVVTKKRPSRALSGIGTAWASPIG